ncbi:MAG: TonB-dependent receptor plug domain-containing protein [Polyangiales bacterium]
MTVLAPGGVGAQTPDEPPVEKTPPEEPPDEKPPATPPAEKRPEDTTPGEPAPAERAPAPPPPAQKPPAEKPAEQRRKEREETRQREGESPAPEGRVAEDENGKEWITPDVAAEQEEEEEDSVGDVDQVIIEYGADAEKGDKVTDAKGKELEEVTLPVVSKAVEVQDPNNLEPGADKETGVQGQVVSRRPKKVLPDAPVLAKGDDGKLRSTLTDDRGRYRLYLPPGKYTLRSYYDLYHGARWDDVLVKRGAFKRINFILDPITEEDAGVEEIEIVYLADTSSEAAQLNIRKETVGVQDAISAEEIKRAGDSTAKGAVKRVVGVTIDEDDRLIIRGLGGRYNQILLNDMPVPGVDPDVPSVRLDIFPADIVSNINVVKVPRPNLIGAFAGGLLMIDTTQYPRDLQIKAGASIGFNSLSTFKQRPTYNGGNRDWLGFDDGSRALPSAVGSDRLDVGTAGSGSRYITRDQVAQVGHQFENVWNPKYKLAIPQLSLKASVGNSGPLKKEDRRAGYQISFIYDYEEAIRTGYNRRYRYNADGEIERTLQDFDIKGGKQEVLWGTFGSAYLELNPDNFLNVTSLFSRFTEDVTLTQLGQREDTGYEDQYLLSKNSYNFIGRSILFNQLTGDHRNLGNTKARFQWNASGGLGKRDEPDRRQVEQLPYSQLVTNAERYYSDLGQYYLEGQDSVRFPVYNAFEQTAYGEIGFYGGYQHRDFTARRFVQQQLGNNQLTGDPEVLFNELNLGDITTIREITKVQDSYTASNRYLAGYAQLETPMAPRLKFLGMMRFEAFTQRVRSQSPFAEVTNPSEIKETDRTDLNPLPSATFRFEVNKEMFVTLGYGMTAIRPAIRELAPFTYVDYIRGWNISGNPDLESTVVQNAEARYEYYFGGTDLFAATAFFKWFDKPIEFVIFNQVNSTAGFRNAETAWLVGGELELRLSFARFHEKLDRLFFVGNVAVMGSQTTLPAGQGISGRLQRRLYNQSPYVTNLSLRFDDPDAGVMVGLVYNAFGPRIVEAGSAAGDFVIPDVFELPQHILDFVASWKPTPHVKIGLKWKNIAFAKKRFKQGGELVLRENFGTTVSIGAEYNY